MRYSASKVRAGGAEVLESAQRVEYEDGDRDDKGMEQECADANVEDREDGADFWKAHIYSKMT